MPTIEVTDKQLKVIEGFADMNGLPVGEAIEKAITTTATLFSIWDEEGAVEETHKCSIQFMGKDYTGDTWKGIYLSIVEEVGVKKIYDLVESPLIKLRLEEDDRSEFYTELTDGRYPFFVRTNISQEGIKNFLRKVEDSLKGR